MNVGAKIFDLSHSLLSLLRRAQGDAQFTSKILLLVLFLTSSSGFELSHSCLNVYLYLSIYLGDEHVHEALP